MTSGVNVEARPVTPLAILVEHLETAVGMVEQEPSVPTAVVTHLRHVLHLAAGLDSYIDECTTEESPALAAIA